MKPDDTPNGMTENDNGVIWIFDLIFSSILFFTVSQIYGYGNIERTYEMQQVYEIITNNNELLHEIKGLNLSSIFLYEVPLPWDPDYVEVEDEERDELYKLKY